MRKNKKNNSVIKQLNDRSAGISEPRFAGPTDPRRGPPTAWAFNLISSRP